MPTFASPHNRPTLHALLLAAAASLLLQACATHTSTQINNARAGNAQQAGGQNQHAIISQRGDPSSVYQQGENTHWFYDTDSIRTERELLVFDSQGVLLRAAPAWTRTNFQQIEPGKTTSLHMLQQFGPALSQGQTSTALLETLGLADKQASTATYWRYAFREHGKHFNVIVLFDEQRQVTDVQIAEDQPTDLYH